jgi:hypothetical protein
MPQRNHRVTGQVATECRLSDGPLQQFIRTGRPLLAYISSSAATLRFEPVDGRPKPGPQRQEAFAAGFTVLGVKVHAGGGIFENETGAPGFAWQSSVTALLKKLQFESLSESIGRPDGVGAM